MREMERRWSVIALVALCFAIGLELIRTFFPPVYGLGEREGFLRAGALVLLVSLAPLLAPLAIRLTGRRPVTAVVTALVTVRVAVQLVHPIPTWLAGAAFAIALLSSTVVVTSVRTWGVGSHALAAGVIVGFALDVALKSATSTWDLTWQTSAMAFVVTAALCAAAVVSLGLSALDRPVVEEPPVRGAIPLVLFGPFLTLEVLFLQNVAFAASQAGLSLPAAATILLIADAAAVAAVRWVSVAQPRSRVRLAAAVLLIACAWSLRAIVGLAVALPLIVGQVLAASFLALALGVGSKTDRTSTAWRTSSALGVAGVLFVLLSLLYQIHYRLPLPFPNAALLPLAGGLLALAGIRSSRAVHGRIMRRLSALPIALLVVPTFVAVAAPEVHTATGDGTSFRLLDYNVRSSVGVNGQLDPEAIATVIEGQHPDVVVLQEVARGWAIAGTLDLTSWLARRLAMRFVFAPAADDQFGNAVLSRFPIVAWRWRPLPFGTGPQQRSYVEATLDLGSGSSATVIGTHLQNTPGSSVGADQVRAVLDAWNDEPRTVIAGDMNIQPDNPDIQLFDEAGLTSAQDATGHSSETTSAAPTRPGDRVDWVFGSPDVAWADFAITQTSASDHLPIAVTAVLS